MNRLLPLVLIATLALAACSSTPSSGTSGDQSSPAPQDQAAPVAESSPGGAGTTTNANCDNNQACIEAAVRNVRPSVVALDVLINGTLVVPSNPLQQLFGGSGGPTLRRVQEQASGSGFVYNRTGNSGYIVTNSHVVHGASQIQVVFRNGDKVPGQLFAEDVGADLALVRVNNYANLPPALSLGTSGEVQQGEWAIAFGEPFALQQTVTVGVVSGFNRDEQIAGEGGRPRTFKGLLQTSAPINPGNSGGPLTDMFGRVIGVNQSTASPTSGAQGIGFAIPVDSMKTTVANLMQNPGQHAGTSSGFIGVQLLPLSGNVRQQLGYNGSNGVAIAGVINGSAADRAGLEPGDIIQSIDNKPVNSPQDLTDALGKTKPGQSVRLTIWRNGAVRTVTVQLTAAPIGAQGPRNNGGNGNGP